MEDKLFLGFGIVVVISGVLLIVEQKYLLGISGLILGTGLVFRNIKKIKNQNNK